MDPRPPWSVLARIVCALGGHRFVVWARTSDPAPRHPHLGAWARCERCGHERDWLAAGARAETRVLDLVHGVVRPLHEVQSIARGAPPPPPAEPILVAASAPAAPPAHRSVRRGGGEGRGSTRREARLRPARDREPQDR